MARFHSQDPLRSRTERSFSKVLSQLNDDWHIFQDVRFELKNQAGAHLSHGEIDAILYHPDHGYLVVEVKAGSWHLEEGRWSHKPLHENTWIPQSRCPRTQVVDGFHWLKNSIENISGKRPRPKVAWALAFPDARRDDCKIPESFVSTKQLFLATFAHDPEKKILEALSTAHFDHHQSSPDDQKLIFEQIQPTVLVNSTPESELDNTAFSVALASREVQKLAKMLRHQEKLQIVGPPGSGKTVLALAWLAEQEGSRALLCFNAPLAAWLRELPEVKEGFFEVRTFHDLGHILVESAFPEEWPADADQAFWNEAFLPLVIRSLERLQSQGDFDGFDALALDECQDFTEAWLELIPRFLAPDGKLAVFHDPLQNLRNQDMVDCGAILDLPPPIELESIHRSPRNIVQWLNQKLGCEFQSEGPTDTPEVLELSAQWENPPHVILNEQLVRLRDKGIPASRISIISVHSKKHSKLRLENLPASWSGTWNHDLVRIDSAMRLKGIENDIVIIVDWQKSDISNEMMRKRLLVAATRAKHSLILIEEV